jgi:hypothetical protein
MFQDDPRSSILSSGKYQGANVQYLSTQELYEAHRASYLDYANNNLIRTEKRRRSWIARQRAFDARRAE